MEDRMCLLWVVLVYLLLPLSDGQAISQDRVIRQGESPSPACVVTDTSLSAPVVGYTVAGAQYGVKVVVTATTRVYAVEVAVAVTPRATSVELTAA